MKSNVLGINWFLTHVPAPGSEREYHGLSREGGQELSPMSREPLTAPQRLAAQDEAAKREQQRLERSYR